MGVITRYPIAAGILAIAVFFVLLGLAIDHQMTPTPAEAAKPAASCARVCTMALYAVWTVAIPVWLFVEFLEARKRRPGEGDSTYEKRFADLISVQEAVRPVWAGCAAAIGIMLI